MKPSPDIVIIGLSITSSWGNGHATTYRGLVTGLAERGHTVLFLEREEEWYSQNRDQPHPKGCVTAIYTDVDDLINNFEQHIVQAKLVMVGSYVPDGIRIGNWVTSVALGHTAFYDIDTPVTMSLLQEGHAGYITPDLIRRYSAYFSFTGGPTLRRIESDYGSPMARVLYCVVDQQTHKPVPASLRWRLGYLGTYSADRQAALEELLLHPATHMPSDRFAVAGPQYPEHITWPKNVERTVHLSPPEHAEFYAQQRFTLNITRAAMKQAGYSPSVRLFEAAACAAPIISDYWAGLDRIFEIGREVLVVESTEEMLRALRDTPESVRLELGERARRRVLAEHSPCARAIQVEAYLEEMNDRVSCTTRLHRLTQQIPCGISSRSSSEPIRDRTSAVPCGQASDHCDSGYLH